MDKDDKTVLSYTVTIDSIFPKLVAWWGWLREWVEAHGTDVNGVPRYGFFDDDTHHYEPNYEGQGTETLLWRKYSKLDCTTDYKALPFEMCDPN